MTAFTLAHAQAAMRDVPEGLEVNTRRQYAQLLHRVLEMAVYPACIIKHNPLPRGFVPKPGKEKAKALPRPSEDAAGLACKEWPLAERMLFGFLAREGMRTSEACNLQWADIDLKVGAITLDENKTDEPRAWALNPHVAEALRRWKAMRKDVAATDMVFKRADGRSHNVDRLAAVYWEYLATACEGRPELGTATKNRLRARAHDMRGMFVTYRLANGKTETWVMDRTGHTTSGMLNRYRRVARTAVELGLGDLVPLADAVPVAASTATATARGHKTAGADSDDEPMTESAREGSRTPTPCGGGT